MKLKSLRNKISPATQAGFTLIELVIVIVIIGILAAVAIPQFSNLSDDAKLGVAQGIAGAGASAAAANYAMRSGMGTSKGIALTSCSALTTIIDMPTTGYTISGTLTAGSTGTCTVTGSPSTVTATFTARGIS